MRLSRSLLPLAAGLMMSLAVATPVRAQGMDQVLQILVEVLAASVQQDTYESSARYDLESELDYIERERERVAYDFDQRRREVKQVARRTIKDIKDHVRRKRERRRRIRGSQGLAGSGAEPTARGGGLADGRVGSAPSRGGAPLRLSGKLWRLRVGAASLH